MIRYAIVLAGASALGILPLAGASDAAFAQHGPMPPHGPPPQPFQQMPPVQRDEQHEARRELRMGAVRSLRDIERQVLPTMKGMQYLGPEYDPTAMAYRLKFLHDGRVTFVDVDARTGAVMNQSR